MHVCTRTNLTRSRLGDVSTKAWQLILRLWHSCAATRMKSFLPSIIPSPSLDFFRVKGSYSYSYRPAYRTSYLLHRCPLSSASLPLSLFLPSFPLAVQFLTAIFLALTKASRSKLRWMKANRQRHRRTGDRGGWGQQSAGTAGADWIDNPMEVSSPRC